MATIPSIRAVIATTLLLLAYPTPAAIITITETTNDFVLVDSSGGPSLSGCSALDEVVLRCSRLYVAPGEAGASQQFEIDLFEGTPLLTKVSDVFRISRTIGLFPTPFGPTCCTELDTFDFISDNQFIETLPADSFPTFFFPFLRFAAETGTPQLFDLPSLCGDCIDMTISITSDIDTGTPVPAPATLALVGLGLAVMGLSRRRHLRKS